MATKTLASEWAEFRRTALRNITNPVQIEETRRGFYAGATTLYHMLLTQVSPGDEVTEADEDMLKSVAAELDEHVRDLLRQAR